MSEPVYIYVVKEGDCLASIAEGAGLRWEDIWNHPQNQALKEKRQDPNILYRGDRLVVPHVRLKEESAATEQKHRFVRVSNKVKFKMRLLQEGDPRASIAYRLEVDGRTLEGKTDSQGYLTVYVPPKAKKGKLVLTDQHGETEEYDVLLGHLDPINEVEGVQKRLLNLGFDCPVSGKLDEKTQAAIGAFRAKHRLAGNGSVDAALVDKLIAVHGS